MFKNIFFDFDFKTTIKNWIKMGRMQILKNYKFSGSFPF